jgi:radical SAM PhpK family P-methyltransferase
MLQNLGLDCVIVGHNDIDFGSVESDLKKTQDYSGAYLDLKANSVNFHGKIFTYIDLLNWALRGATGREHNYHVCRLPHLGAAYLKSFLTRRNLNVEIVNFYTFEKDRLAELLAREPNAVAITTTLYVEHSPIIEIVDFIRRRNPEVKIIVGGPHVFNIYSTQVLKAQDFIFRMIGADLYILDSQGELTLSRLLYELRNKKNADFTAIPNLIYTFDNKKFHRTGRMVEDNDMDENVIDWTLFERDFYVPTVQIRTARSCAFKCSFCRYPATAGALNLTSLDLIERELKQLQTSKVRNVVFIDDTFNVPLERFKDICRMMIRNKFEFNWFSFFRCSNSDDQAFDLMKESGCSGVFLGIESGDQTILKNMNKFANLERYRSGINKLKERGILTFASIIVGFPGETEETVKNTIHFLTETSPTFYRAELYYHYTNVPIHQQAEQFGILGAGYSWSHHSMDWKMAGQYLKAMYKSIKGPVILPGYMFDFWSIPYLMGMGMSADQIISFSSIAQEMLVQSLDNPIESTMEQESRLLSLFRP